MNLAETSAERLQKVLHDLRRAEKTAGRGSGSTELIAVSKTFSATDIRPVLAAGQRLFGENRVQEAQEKWPALKAEFPDVELHLIGSLQSNKAREAVALFDVIHSLDRLSLAEALAREIERAGRAPKLLVQVNTGEEPQKGGVVPAELSVFLADCTGRLGLTISGLMCIPPADEPPGPHFALLAKLADCHQLSLRSMGMSADYFDAVMLGATHVRVGSAIFGHR